MRGTRICLAHPAGATHLHQSQAWGSRTRASAREWSCTDRLERFVTEPHRQPDENRSVRQSPL